MALDWTGRQVLITGVAGFVGSNLAKMLMDAKACAVGLDLVETSPSLRALNVSVPIFRRTITDANEMDSSMRWMTPEVVFHLGGMGHISDCQQHPLAAWEANVQGTWNVLEACRKLPTGQIQAMVVASSNHVFGSRRAAWREDDPCGQTDVYGTSKGCVDLITKAYGAMGLPVAALRHVNCFGPADPHRSHLVTGTICDLLEGKQPVIRGDGTPMKGYLHVEDVCHAYLAMAESLVAGRIPSGSAVNAGTEPISVLALVDLLIQTAGVDVVPDIRSEDLSQSGYVEMLDDSTLRGLGWYPDSLVVGLRAAWDWYRAHGGMAWLSA